MLDTLLQRQSLKLVNRFNFLLKNLTHSDSSLVKSLPRIKTLVEKDRSRKKRIFKEHFIENLFLGRFEEEVLEYPQVNTLIEFESLFRHYKYAKILVNRVADDNENLYENDAVKVVTNLKRLEFSGFKLPKNNNGFGYLESEYTFIQEAISQDLSLSKTVSENEDFCVQLINLFGTNSQKETYLPKLASGQSLACFAHLESGPLASLDAVSVDTSAVKTSDGESYLICGKKNWVYNATFADIIIFSANTIDEEEKVKPTLFLVEKTLKGIEIHEPIKKIGLRGLDICEVSFNQVVVPSSCILGNVHEGEKLVKKILTNGKLNNGAQCITLMKKLVNIAVKHCIHNKLLNKNKFEREYFKAKIGNLVSRIYLVESMTYLLTGRLDSFENSDVFLESIILKVQASESLQFVLQETLTILGTKAFERENDLEKIMKDSQFFITCDDTNDYLRLLLSTTGCKHVLKYRAETNPFRKFMSYITIENFKKWNNFGSDVVLNSSERLKGYLHLMLQLESGLLEDCVFNLKESVNFLFKKHEEQLFKKDFELKLLADLVINIYSMTALLGRASRAYCLAVKNHKVDVRIAEAEVCRLLLQSRKTKNLIKQCSEFRHLGKVGCGIMEEKSYANSYPVISNLVVRN